MSDRAAGRSQTARHIIASIASYSPRSAPRSAVGVGRFSVLMFGGDEQ